MMSLRRITEKANAWDRKKAAELRRAQAEADILEREAALAEGAEGAEEGEEGPGAGAGPSGVAGPSNGYGGPAYGNEEAQVRARCSCVLLFLIKSGTRWYCGIWNG